MSTTIRIEQVTAASGGHHSSDHENYLGGHPYVSTIFGESAKVHANLTMQWWGSAS